VSVALDVAAAARDLGTVLNYRIQELENKLHTELVHVSDLELEAKATLRRVEMLERRLARAEAKPEGSGEAESGG